MFVANSYIDYLFFFLYFLLIPIHPFLAKHNIFNIKNKYFNIFISVIFVLAAIYFQRYVLILSLFFIKYEDITFIKNNLKNKNWNRIPKKYKYYYEKEYIDYLFRTHNIKKLKNFIKKMSDYEKDVYYNMTGQFHKASQVNHDLTIAYSIDPKDYVIQNSDYKRSNDIDYNFKNNYKRDIVKIFDDKCCNCGATKELELDHFFIPKSMGGNFIMYHKKGFKVINCILLCSKCNKMKSNKQDFFKKETIYKIQKKLSRIQKAINDRKYYV